MIFQFYHLLPELTTLENVLAPLMIGHGALGLPRAGGDNTAPGQAAAGNGRAGPSAEAQARGSSPAARCSGRPSPGPWSPAPDSCWPTSRPATSTRPPARKSPNPALLEPPAKPHYSHGYARPAIAEQADRIVRLVEGRIELNVRRFGAGGARDSRSREPALKSAMIPAIPRIPAPQSPNPVPCP